MKQVMLAVVSAMFFATMASAVNADTQVAVCEYGKGTVAEVICNGPAILKDTQVTGAMKVVGPLTARNISVGDISVSGSVDMQDSDVKGGAIIAGDFQASNVVFNRDMDITSNNTQLSHVKLVGSMTVHSSSKDTPYVLLQCGTIIYGAITFIGTPGVVRVTDDSGVQGKITNGTQEFIHKKC